MIIRFHLTPKWNHCTKFYRSLMTQEINQNRPVIDRRSRSTRWTYLGCYLPKD